MKIWDLKRFSTFQIAGCGSTEYHESDEATVKLDTYRYHGMDGAFAKVTLLGYESEGIFAIMPPNGEVINGTLDDQFKGELS